MTDTIELRGHHVPHLHRAILHGADVSVLSKYISAYPGQTIDFEVAIYRMIIDDPDVKVKIVDTLDVLCKRGCPERKLDCIGQLGKDADISDAKLYGLEIGKSYSSKELVDMLKGKEYPWAYLDNFKFTIHGPEARDFSAPFGRSDRFYEIE